MINQGYKGGSWVVKPALKELSFWIDGFWKPYLIFTHRSFESVFKSTFGDDNSKKNKEIIQSKYDGLNFCMEEVKNNPKLVSKVINISPYKIVENNNWGNFINILEDNNLIFYTELFNHFVVKDYWHQKEKIND